mgnify:CR=1 FL=1
MATTAYPKQNITKDLDLGTITLSEDSKSLDEVVIITEKTTVDIRLDKKVIAETISYYLFSLNN